MTAIMENQTEENMRNMMETGVVPQVLLWHVGLRAHRLWLNLTQSALNT